MKYTVHYGRKTPTRAMARDMVEVGLAVEFDDSVTPVEIGFKIVRDKVEEWIKEAVSGEKPKPKPERPVTTMIQTVAQAFPQELKGQLYFEDSGDYILVKARKFLDSNTFKKVADIVKGKLGGEYVSAGRKSHFRIRKLGV